MKQRHGENRERAEGVGGQRRCEVSDHLRRLKKRHLVGEIVRCLRYKERKVRGQGRNPVGHPRERDKGQTSFRPLEPVEFCWRGRIQSKQAETLAGQKTRTVGEGD